MKTKEIKNYVNGKLNYLQSEPNFLEPILIKAGSNLLKLGINEVPPRVDCRVIAEDNYQRLIRQFQSDAVECLEFARKRDWLPSLKGDHWIKYPREKASEIELYDKFLKWKEEQK